MRVLVVTNSSGGAQSIRAHLRAEFDQVTVDVARSPGATMSRLAQAHEDNPYDVVVSRFVSDDDGWIDRLAQSNGVSSGSVSFVAVVDSDDEEAALEAFQQGADRILRDQPGRDRDLGADVAVALRQAHVLPQYQEHEQELREVLSDSEEALLLIDDGAFVDCNEAAAEFLGYETRAEIIGSTPAALSPPTQPSGESSAKKAERMMQLGAEGGYHRFEWTHRRADGEAVAVDVSLTPIIFEGNRMLYCVWREASDQYDQPRQASPLQVDAPVVDTAAIRTDIDVLVVDPDGDRRAELVGALDRGSDIETTAVSTGNEAILSIDSPRSFDCLLTAQSLPDIGGVELLEQIRDNRPEFPAIVVLEAADADLADSVLGAGATDYVVWQSDPETARAVLEKVRVTVGQSRLQRSTEPTAILAMQDTTERTQRQVAETLAQGLFELVATLAGARTRPALGSTVVEGLTDRGYDLAWIGSADGSVLHPQDVDGHAEYLEAFDRSLTDATDTAEPAIWAARTGETRVVRDIASLFSAEWQRAALDADFASGLAVPITYHTVTYGVLAVYSSEADRFADPEREVLEQFADALGFAIHALDFENRLASRNRKQVTLELAAGPYYLAELARNGAFEDDRAVSVLGSFPLEESTVVQFVSVAGGSPERASEVLGAHSDVESVTIVAGGDPARLQVTVSGPVPEGVLAGQGVTVSGTRIRPDGVQIDIELPPDQSTDLPVDALAPEFGPVSIRSSTAHTLDETETASDPFERAELTDKQSAALQTAYHHGYFDRPRRATATEIADSLGVAHSTFLQHLHRAQQKVFASRFE